MIVVGLMSGTSADGVDAAVVDIDGAPPALKVTPLSFTYVPFDQAQRASILALFDPASANAERICQTNFALGEWFASSALRAVEEAGLALTDVALIGSHGQTVFHAVGQRHPTGLDNIGAYAHSAPPMMAVPCIDQHPRGGSRAVFPI